MTPFAQLESLDIGVPCGRLSERYFEFLAWSALETARRPEILRFLVLPNNGADARHFESLAARLPVRVLEPEFVPQDDPDHAGGILRSLGHGKALDRLFGAMRSPVGMLVDCDVALVMRGWDEVLYARLDERCPIVGSAYPPEEPGTSLRPKYLGFPNALACMFDVAVLRRAGVGFLPNGYAVLDERSAALYGRRAGEQLSLDVGHELPLKLRGLGYAGVALGMVWPDDAEARVLQDHEALWRLPRLHLPQEFQLAGEPVFVHLGKSESRPFGKDPVAKRWEADVRDYLGAR